MKAAVGEEHNEYVPSTERVNLKNLIEHRMDSTSLAARPSITFGRFRIYPEERRLVFEEQPVEIGSRAFDVLLLLVKKSGLIVTHKEFHELVWPQAIVEDVNLRVHVNTVRKILSRDITDPHGIRSITGRGYSFVGAVTFDDQQVSLCTDSADLYHADIGSLIGRRHDVQSISALLAERNLVSIVGPGGIGKTAVAYSVIRAFQATRRVTAVSIELSSISHSDQVASTVASMLGILSAPRPPHDAIIDYLKGSPYLLLLDCCEHVIDGVAVLVEMLTRAEIGANVLVTSREPLRVSSEWVYRIEPLDVPSLQDGLSTEMAIKFPAVKLFCERAMSAHVNEFRLDTDNVRQISAICRALDGLPLAIELAASQIHMLGAQGLLDALGNILDPLTKGQRTALPRHKTMRATIDWSYETLSASERIILRHVAMFKGRFNLIQAAALIDCQNPVVGELAACVASLVDKSLVSIATRTESLNFHLLDTTRAYGIEKLALLDEYAGAAHRHARYYLSLFTEPVAWSSSHRATDALVNDPDILDDVRAALEWSLSEHGDPGLGLALTWASAPLFYQLSFFDEYRQRVNHALSLIDKAGDHKVENAFRLQLALAQADFLTQSLKHGTSTRAFHAALTLAEQQGHEVRQMQVLYGTIVMTTMAGEYQEAAELCQRLFALSQANDRRMYHRMQALVETQSGRVERALLHAERALSLYGPRHTIGKLQDPTQYDGRTALTSLEARILWLLGRVDDAVEVAAQSVEEAMTLGHDLSLCCSLASGACPVASWRGDINELRRYLSMLDALSTEYLLINWRDQAQCYAFALPERTMPEGRDWCRQFDSLAASAHETLVTVSPYLLTPLAIQRGLDGRAGWATAEILRALGERRQDGDVQPSQQSEDLFRRALSMAHGQGLLSFELRAATSLASLLNRRGNWTEAEDVLGDVLSRFTQGKGTKDIRIAHQLMEQIGSDRQPHRRQA